MELTILLSKVFGLYYLVVGLMMLLRRGWFKSVVTAFVESPALRFFAGILMLIGGFFIIVSHQDWSNLPAGFISLLGWAIAVKAILYMNLSNNAVKKWTGWFKINGVSGVVWSLLVVVIGLYLTNFGFGWY